MVSVADTLKKVRREAGLTQKQLSDVYKIPIRTLQDWERGLRTPPEYVIGLLLRCLSVDYPSVQGDLSGQTQKATTRIFLDDLGRPLPERLAKFVREEFEAGRVQEVESFIEDGNPMDTVERGYKEYQCTDVSANSEIPFGFVFRVKEA